AWTGRFLSWEKMTIPKTRPSAHTTSPHMRSARPPTPPNVTVPRSGTLRLASPPPAASAGGTATETSARTTSAGRSPNTARGLQRSIRCIHLLLRQDVNPRNSPQPLEDGQREAHEI